MSKHLPPLNPLRAFESAARNLSMSRAAGELNVTHGAISHQVRSLERTLGFSLFIRHGKALQLSAQGALLLPTITRAFGTISEAVALLSAPSVEGTLVICCLPSLMTFWLVPRLERFSQRHPGVSLRLISSNDRRRVYASDVDVWITYGIRDWPDRDSELWVRPSLFPVCSPALMNSKPVRSVEDFRLHTLLHGDDGEEWNIWLDTAGVPELACGAHHFMSDAQLSTHAAIHGQGIALCDSLTGVDLLASGRLVVPLDLKIPALESWYLVYRRELRRAPLVRDFISWMFAETAGQPEDARSSLQKETRMTRSAHRSRAKPQRIRNKRRPAGKRRPENR